MTLGNSVSVTQSSTLNVTDADVASLGALDINPGQTLTTGGYGLARFIQTTLNGSGANTYGFDTGAAGDIAPGRLINGATNAATIVKTGAGNLILDESANAPIVGGGISFDIQGGRLAAVSQSGQQNPLGAGSPIALNGAGVELELFSRSGSFTFDNAVAVNQDATMAANSNNNSGLTITLGSGARPVSLANGTTLRVDTFSNVTLLLAGGIPGASTGSLVKTGPGTLQLGGAAAHSGPTLVNQGTLQVNTGASLPSTSALTTAARTGLTLNATGAINPAVPIVVGSTGAATLTLGATNAITASNQLSIAAGSTLAITAADGMAPTWFNSFLYGAGGIATLNLQAAGATSADIAVYSGNRTYINNATAVDSNLAVNPGAILEVAVAGLTGSGAISRAPASILRLTNAGALTGAQLGYAALAARDVVQINANNITSIQSMPAGSVIEVWNGNRTLLPNSATGVTLDNVYLTQDNAGRSMTDNGSSWLAIGPSGLTIASSSGQSFTVTENITTGANPLTIGSFRPLNNLFKSGTVRLNHGTANDFAGSTVNVVTGTLAGTATTGGWGGFGADLARVMHPTLYGGTLRVDSGSTSAASSLNVGAVTVAGQGALSVGRASSSYTTTMWLNDPIVRTNGGTVSLFTSNSTLGGTERVQFVTASEAPARLATSSPINMVAPWMLNTSGSAGHFVDYNPTGTTGFTNVTYDPNTTSFAGSTDATIKEITSAVTNNDPVMVAALRTTQAISGTGSIGIATGGLIIDSTTARTIANNISFGSAEGIVYSLGATHVLSGVVSGINGLTKFGPNVLNLTNTSNDFTGTVTINQGTLQAAGDGALGASSNPIVFGGGALNLPTMTLTRPITINAGGGTLDTTGTLTVNTSITGAGPLFKTGAGTVILGSANSHQGGTLVNAGALQVADDAALGAAGGFLVVNNATLRAGGTFYTARDTYLYNTATIDTQGNTVTHGGEIRGTGNLVKTGTGILELTSPTGNGWTGTTTINAGTLYLGWSPAGRNQLTSAAVTIGNGSGNDILRLGASNQIIDSAVLTFRGTGANAGIFRLNNQSETVAGIQGTGIIENESGSPGTGTLTVRQFAGASHIYSGLVRDGDGVGSDGQLALTKDGRGTLTLTNTANTYSGPTNVNQGMLVGAGGTALGTGPVTVASSGTLALSLEAKGLIGEYYNITPQNVGSQNPNFATLAALNSHLAGQPIALLAPSSLAGANFDFATNGSLFPVPYNSGATNFEVRWTGKFNAPVAGDYYFWTGSDDGSMVWIDGQEPAAVNNNYFQGVTWRGGTAVPLTAGLHDITIGFYQGGGGYGLQADVQGPAGSGLETRQRLPNSYLSSTVGGNLTIGSLAGDGTVQLGPFTLTTGGDGTDTVFAGTIAGTGGLTKTGAGTFTLSGANTYTGDTLVSAGTLALGGGGSIGLSPNIHVALNAIFDVTAVSPYALASGQMLTGNGTVVGDLDVALGALISAGNTPGHLMVDGSYTQSGTMVAELGGTGQGVSYDWIEVFGTPGTAALGGVIQVRLVNGFVPEPGAYFDIITATGGVTGFDLVELDFSAAQGGPVWWYWIQDLPGGGQALRLNASPEPTSLTLLALGGLALLRRRRCRFNR